MRADALLARAKFFYFGIDKSKNSVIIIIEIVKRRKMKMKEIKKTVIAYEADDGTVFDTAKECDNYESRKRINEVKKFDRDFNPSSYNSCHYLVIRSSDDVKIIKAHCEEYGMWSPWDEQFDVSEDFRGVLVYECDDWYSLDEQIADLVSQRDRILELCSH